MTTLGQEMTRDQHVATALEFLEHSDQCFETGDFLQGSGKLWDAACHAVIAVAQHRGWTNYKSHADMKQIVRDIAAEQDNELLANLLRCLFGVAEKFHLNFCHNLIPENQLESDRPQVHYFVHRLVDMAR